MALKAGEHIEQILRSLLHSFYNETTQNLDNKGGIWENYFCSWSCQNL